MTRNLPKVRTWVKINLHVTSVNHICLVSPFSLFSFHFSSCPSLIKSFDHQFPWPSHSGEKEISLSGDESLF